MDRGLAVLVVIGIAMHFWGVALNAAVMLANGGSMPVIGLTAMDLVMNDDGLKRRAVFDGNAKYPLLADRLRIDLPDIAVTGKAPGKIVSKWAELLDYPLEAGEYIASIGDILRWLGSALFLVMLPVLIVRIPFRLRQDRIELRRQPIQR
jgi:hypothetical protein